MADPHPGSTPQTGTCPTGQERAGQEGAGPTAELPALALSLLAHEDLDGYRRLLAQVESSADRQRSDRQRRYWLVASALELGLEMSVPAERRVGLHTALATAALEELEREPSEPRLLMLAGAALSELASVEAAEAMLSAAGRLDPHLPGLESSLRALAAHRRRLRGSPRPAVTATSTAELSRRAHECAALARPAEGLRLSLCMIVRDEQEMLGRCLEAVAEAVDEIVILDTGSTDATIEIARSFGARVLERPWTGSFAEARNVSFEAAGGDWILYLDADEVLVREDTTMLRSLTTRTWREAFYLVETNHTGELDGGGAVTHSALRLLRNRPEYRFEGRVHEQISQCLPGYLPERIEASTVRVEHFGYLASVRRDRAKSQRNIELLHMQQAEGTDTPFLHYNLGCEHAAAGDAPVALAAFERSWELLQALPDRDSHRFQPALIVRLVKALRACGRPQDALTRAADGLERFPELTDLVLEQAHAARELAQPDRAIALYGRCIEMGDAPRRYTASVGCGSYLPSIHLAELLRARGQLERARELLERCLREHPGFLGSVAPYASALLAAGEQPEAVLERVERLLGEISPTARFMLATALCEAGASAAGEMQLREVLARQPHCARARVALAESLLAQRRYADAAEEAAALDVDDPLAMLACRSELFARIAGGDATGAQDALERARTAGMPRAELELFAGWAQLAVHGRTEVAPAAEAVALLEVMLEALLRVHDFETFETLLGLLERTPLAARERRELLAAIYLRRGFAASAAQEWMAVCEEQPDTRALLGLAQVAVATGMPQEAGEFAAAALSKDPGNELATVLLASVQGEAVGTR
jgi:tetratricopeptide (TPR) repeat protein